MNRVPSLTPLVLIFCFPAAPACADGPPLDAPRPIEALDTVFMEEMTWMEVRDAIAAGKTTAIVATGGVEQNGPYLATGKHNFILRPTTQAIARRLGNALVAPIVPFVPEGDIDPPSGHMCYPGTISVSEATFETLLTDICASLRIHGFKNVVLLGDSGGNQQGMQRVAGLLDARWSKSGPRVHYVPEYYNYAEVAAWLEKEGIHQRAEGLHDDFAVTAQLMTVDSGLVRMKERGAAGKFSINGIELAPASKTIEWGKRIIDFRANATVRAIERAIGS
ncbi:MAG TPA: creatininase family protein [Pirellulales bacterium]|nr:creatininase family protein [Pirellulales bacterium]